MGKDSKGHGSNPHSGWSDEKLRTHFDRYAKMRSPTDAHMDKMEAIGNELEARKKLAYQQPAEKTPAQGKSTSLTPEHRVSSRSSQSYKEGMRALGLKPISPVCSTTKNKKY